jgi:hypothetical protein
LSPVLAVTGSAGSRHFCNGLNWATHIDKFNFVANFSRQLAKDLIGEGWRDRLNAIEIENNCLSCVNQTDNVLADFLAEYPATKNFSVFVS